MVGFIQRSSDPSQPGRALDKKIQKLHNFFYVFIIFIITKFGKKFKEKIDICFLKNVDAKSFWNVKPAQITPKQNIFCSTDLGKKKQPI